MAKKMKNNVNVEKEADISENNKKLPKLITVKQIDKLPNMLQKKKKLTIQQQNEYTDDNAYKNDYDLFNKINNRTPSVGSLIQPKIKSARTTMSATERKPK